MGVAPAFAKRTGILPFRFVTPFGRLGGPQVLRTPPLAFRRKVQPPTAVALQNREGRNRASANKWRLAGTRTFGAIDL